MTQYVYLVTFLALAIGLVSAFFFGLPDSPFTNTINDLITFLDSDTVAQGLSWLAWCFPIGDVVNWFPAFINALIAFFTLRGTLFVLSLHV